MRIKAKVFGGIILFLAAAVLFLAACERREQTTGDIPAIPEGKKLIVCTSHKKEVYEPIIREFEERTGIWVDVRQGGTKSMLETVKAGYYDGLYDIMFGGGVETLNSYRSCFEPYEAAGVSQLSNSLKSADNSWTPFTQLPIVFIYNTKIVSEDEAPSAWADLFDVKWKGQISFASPFDSGTSYTIISALLQKFDESGTERNRILKAFYDQLNGSLASGSGQVLQEVADGSKSIGITLEEAAIRRIRDGEHIGMIYPSDGIVAVPDGCAIVKNAPDRENAELFVDFIISDDVQKYMVEELYRRTVREDISNPSYFRDIEPAGFDIIRSGEEEEEILELWGEYELN